MTEATTETLPAKAQTQAVGMQRTGSSLQDWSSEDKALIRSIFPIDKLSETDFKIFCMFSKALDLNPLAKEIYPIPYKQQGVYHMSLVTSIQALRRFRDETGKYRGCLSKKLRVVTKSGEKTTISHEEYDPEEHTRIISATYTGRVEGFDEPQSATVVFKSFAKTYDGRLQGQWAVMPDHMILKCAEAALLRETGLTTKPGKPTLYLQEESQAIDVEFSAVPITPQADDAPETTVASKQGRSRTRKAAPQTELPPEKAEEEPPPPVEEAEAPPAEAAAEETPGKEEAAPGEEPQGEIEHVWKQATDYYRSAYNLSPESEKWALETCVFGFFDVTSLSEIPIAKKDDFRRYCKTSLLEELLDSGHIKKRG